MKQITERLTFANVMSAIAVFLVLGGTAFAASQLGKNTVGTKQLKKNAVTKAKIKKGAVSGDKLANGAVSGGKLADGAVTEGKLGPGAVTDGKIKDGAVTAAKLGDNSVGTSKIQNGAVNGDKVADGSLTGADINPGSTSFSQIVARLRNAGPINMQAATATLLGTYSQPGNEDDIFFGGLDVTFQASCAPPRSAVAFLLLNNPTPTAESIVGQGIVTDSVGGTVSKRIDIADYSPPFGFSGMKRIGSGSVQNHAFFIYTSGSCNSGAGITGANLGVDVLGTK